jgi:hypothetical protein
MKDIIKGITFITLLLIGTDQIFAEYLLNTPQKTLAGSSNLIIKAKMSEKALMPKERNKLYIGKYLIEGYRTGLVQVKYSDTGALLRSFEMQQGVVREVFLLDKGRTVAASQKNHTLFWDINTGRIIRRFPERVYGFSHRSERFFTFTDEGVFLYAYPSFQKLCHLALGQTQGPETFLFSPDDSFLAIVFVSGRPASDENYPGTDLVLRGVRYSRLFQLEPCREVYEVFEANINYVGSFSKDSRRYKVSPSTSFDLSRYRNH